MLERRRALIASCDSHELIEFVRELKVLGFEIIGAPSISRVLRDVGITTGQTYPEETEFDPSVVLAVVSLGDPAGGLDANTLSILHSAIAAGIAVVTDEEQYSTILEQLRSAAGVLSTDYRCRLATTALQAAAEHSLAVASRLTSNNDGDSVPPTAMPASVTFELVRTQSLRYGENPHQEAAFYTFGGQPRFGLADMHHLHGPELSYNNLLDLSAAVGLVMEFDEPAAVAIKHMNPCGVALGGDAGEAMRKARECDQVSIYGGIVGINRPLDDAVVDALEGIFVEILFAPHFNPHAFDRLRKTRRKARIIQIATGRAAVRSNLVEYRSVFGGVLAQQFDSADLDPNNLTVVSRREPSSAEWAGLRFAWRIAKHTKSNAIVLARPDQVIGVGAGQMNRLDSAQIAVTRARTAGFSPAGSVCASDAFFPFRDALDVVAAAGTTAVIQPGGSMRDAEVIEAADQHRLAMIHTGIRHFRH